jgi:hypothetical protein
MLEHIQPEREPLPQLLGALLLTLTPSLLIMIRSSGEYPVPLPSDPYEPLLDTAGQ